MQFIITCLFTLYWQSKKAFHFLNKFQSKLTTQIVSESSRILSGFLYDTLAVDISFFKICSVEKYRASRSVCETKDFLKPLEMQLIQCLKALLSFKKTIHVTSSLTAQKMKFSIKDLVTFTEKILNVKLHFLCSEISYYPAQNFTSASYRIV